MHAASDAARSRALRSFLIEDGTGSWAAVRVPGRGEYGKTCTLVIPVLGGCCQGIRERAIVLGGEADDHVGREVEVHERLEPRAVRSDRVAPPHCSQDGVVTRLQRHVQVARHDGRLAHRVDQIVGDVIDLDRRQTKAVQALDGARFSDEPREGHPGGPVAEAAEVDTREHDLAVALRCAAPDLCDDRCGRTAPRRAADEWNHAKGTRERTPVLNSHKRTDPVEAVLRLNAADRADVARDRVGNVLAASGDDADVAARGRRMRSPARLAAHPVT